MEKISYNTGDRKDRVTAVTQAIDVRAGWQFNGFGKILSTDE